jgi:hypothetical protein
LLTSASSVRHAALLASIDADEIRQVILPLGILGIDRAQGIEERLDREGVDA